MNDKQLINEIIKKLEDISSALSSLLWLIKDVNNKRKNERS
jgi:hypothetical protein|tara:strand:+ start:433 stop:555 length:123 start_codon:yes stop_codon:yes gene_type:complete